MKGYSKIKLMNSNTESKSMDSSDQTIKTPRIKNPISIKKPTITIIQQQPKKLDDDYDHNHSPSNKNQEQQDENFSHDTTNDANVTSSLSSRFKIEKQHSTGRTLQTLTAVKRVMSIGRSSSVSERYSRIHDRYANPFDVEDVERQDEEVQMGRSKKNVKKSGSILKACKRVFGL